MPIGEVQEDVTSRETFESALQRFDIAPL